MLAESTPRGAVLAKPSHAPVVLSTFGITQDRAEMLDRWDSFEIAKQVEKEHGDGIVAATAEDGVGVGGDGADEGEIDDGSYELRRAAAGRAVVAEMDEFLAGLVMGKPAGLFLGKRFGVTPVDCRIDFAEFPDETVYGELGESPHLKAPMVSRENLRPSKKLFGSPLLFSNDLYQTLPTYKPAPFSRRCSRFIFIVVDESGRHGATELFLRMTAQGVDINVLDGLALRVPR